MPLGWRPNPAWRSAARPNRPGAGNPAGARKPADRKLRSRKYCCGIASVRRRRTPPYPSSKLITEEEASLTLRLTIDERGRVIAVEPVGRADPVFLAAARRHLLARWRYKPASEDGRAIASTAVITLRFQLDG